MAHPASGSHVSALSRLLNDSSYRDEAAIAVETTRQSVELGIGAVGGNYSLCHGLAGNAEVLLEAGDEQLARRVGAHGLEHFGRGRLRWPCGAGGGETPNLCLGLAGIGYFYLRLADQRTPSVLLPRRDPAWSSS